jgi:hypothetical protein
VNHEEIQVSLHNVVLDVQLLKHLQQLLEAEPLLFLLLLLQGQTPHQHPTDLDVGHLLHLARLDEPLALRQRSIVGFQLVVGLEIFVLALFSSRDCHLLELKHDQAVQARNYFVLGLPQEIIVIVLYFLNYLHLVLFVH